MPTHVHCVLLGCGVNGDGGCDAGGLIVTVKSVKSGEGSINIIVEWKVRCVCIEPVGHHSAISCSL